MKTFLSDLYDVTPYWLIHAFVAVSIQLTIYAITGNTLAGLEDGISFYAGREIRDKEKLGYWDLPGIAGPTIIATTLHFFL